ncbi:MULTISPECIES: hypothetical protein [Methylobacterium]|uniref:hypothetical protein n=1 Tax=Methylobacterium TaxID=407 RepID=UPI001EE31F62|nr:MULTISPECIES: hypothetical protein [Methylobacterium]
MAPRRLTDAEWAQAGVRPVALPALAAACRNQPIKARTDAAKTGRRGILAMVHEDTPVV